MFWKRSVHPKGRTKKVVIFFHGSGKIRNQVEKSTDLLVDEVRYYKQYYIKKICI